MFGFNRLPVLSLLTQYPLILLLIIYSLLLNIAYVLN